MMAFCSGLSAPEAEPDLPSKAANGLDTGFGAWARDPSPCDPSPCDGAAGLPGRGRIDPVVLFPGRAVGRGTCANAGTAVRKPSNNAAVASLRPVRVLWCAAIGNLRLNSRVI